MQDELHNKLAHLKEYIKELDSVAIAFSSGVDSTFLLKVAHEILGDNVMAITVQSGSFPKRELNEAIAFCKKEDIRHKVCQVDEMKIEGFSQNPPNRCYLCKHALFEKIGAIAEKNEIAYVAEGSNMDDLGDYRPGLQAVEMCIRDRYYRLSNPTTEEICAWEFVHTDEKEQSKVLLNIVMQVIHGNMTVNYVKLQGLEETAVYREEKSGKRYTGAALMYGGMPLPIEPSEYQAYQYFFVKE